MKYIEKLASTQEVAMKKAMTIQSIPDYNTDIRNLDLMLHQVSENIAKHGVASTIAELIKIRKDKNNSEYIAFSVSAVVKMLVEYGYTGVNLEAVNEAMNMLEYDVEFTHSFMPLS
jgi:hypothetical protein